MNIEARGRFLPCQKSALTQALIARTQFVLVNDVFNASRCEPGVLSPAASGLTGTISLLIEQIRYLRIDVVVEEPVDQFDNSRLRCDLLRGGLWDRNC
jgi:predicted TIM-barrel enzyme